MRASLKTIFSSPEPRFGADAKPLTVVRSPTARVMRLRVDPRDGAVRLSLPKRTSLRAAFAWAEAQRGWIEAQLAGIAPGVAFAPGLVLSVGGEPLKLVSDEGARGVRRHVDALIVGGDPALLPARVLRWLKAEARRLLESETRALGAQAGVSIGHVGVGDTRSRWGSCSARGDIRYSWRLILAPSFVRRSTVAHEVAHRVHMNHGPAFKALEEELLGESPAAARTWLRGHGAGLYRVGR